MPAALPPFATRSACAAAAASPSAAAAASACSAAATSAAVSSAAVSSRSPHCLPSWYCHTAAPTGTAPAVAKAALQPILSAAGVLGAGGELALRRSHFPVRVCSWGDEDVGVTKTSNVVE